jgi:Reverse transcriptase (RNA-dependent DNA polymerase)
LALNNNFTVEQIDIAMAFLYGELNETVYLYQPDGFIELKLALDKSLNGIVLAARIWMKNLCESPNIQN